MSKKKASFLLLLDKSGSMSGVKDTTIKGVDDFIDSITVASKENNVESTVSVITFDDRVDIEEKMMYQDPADFGSIRNRYHIRGGTAIYDAIGTGLEHFDGNKNSVVVLFTDGGEYDSKVFNDTSAGALVTSKQKSGWTVAFVSPVGNCEQFAAQINIGKADVMQYESGNRGTRRAFSRLGLAAERYLAQLGTDEAKSSGGFFADLAKGATMKVKNMQIVLHTPKALKSKKNGDNEEKQELPPESPAPAYVVDEYAGCPDNWMHGSSKASSYFVPVKEGRGMWLDFNGCDKEYDIAAVVSVQGVNPITGQKTDVLRLERYENKCPKHNCDFQQDRFCPECEYKWPAQNYLTTTSTPDGEFWIDGFRDEDGKIRQYIFTEEQARGVANAMIGEDRVFAVGVAFYKSKKKKPVQEILTNASLIRSLSSTYSLRKSAMQGARGMTTPQSYGSPSWGSSVDISYAAGAGAMGPRGPSGPSGLMGMSGPPGDPGPDAADYFSAPVACCAVMDCNSSEDTDTFADTLEALSPVKYEVGAGASVNQTLHEDKESLDYWETEPTGFIYVNYADENTVKKILAQGKRKMKKGGFLAAVPVGN